VIGLGLIGCGWAAGEILRVAQEIEGLRVVTAFDADPARAADYAARAGVTASADLDALLGNPEVAAVYVGLPHHLLAQTVERALAAGKHVLGEKPLALDPGDARRLGQQAESKGLKLSVFYELRRAATVEMARKLVAEGAVGTPRFVRLRTIIDKRPSYYWAAPGVLNWRARKAEAGGGVLLMNTVHQLDTLRYVTGLEYLRASGSIATFTAPGEVEDTASATVALSNGGLVSLAATAHSPGAGDEETIEIDGTEGRLDIPDPFGTAPIRLYRKAEATRQEIPIERNDSHRAMVESFVRAIVTNGSVPASADDAAAAIAVVQAIYRSHEEGRAVEIQAS
jgi:1,5-anhydro-D-fructose reductase (1,5-anhydro-D-mannitol-forming)